MERDDGRELFRTAPATELGTKTTAEKNHGRIEARSYAASKPSRDPVRAQLSGAAEVCGHRDHHQGFDPNRACRPLNLDSVL